MGGKKRNHVTTITKKEGEEMGAMMCGEYKSLNLGKLSFSAKPLSTKEAISDVTTMRWSKDVCDGKCKVTISQPHSTKERVTD